MEVQQVPKWEEVVFNAQTALIAHQLREVLCTEVSGVFFSLRYLPVSRAFDCGLHAVTPIPKRWQTGCTSGSMEQLRMEYGCCSLSTR